MRSMATPVNSQRIWQGRVSVMSIRTSTSTLGFAVADEDRALLDELVAYFGNGNRSAYLRATLRVMRSVKLAEGTARAAGLRTGQAGRAPDLQAE
jgi:hypothetical protein